VVTVISRFKVRNGLEDDVRRAFLNRPRLVENVSGFCGLSILTDATDASIFLLVTRWADAESFQTWHRSDAHHRSHALIPAGLKLDASFTSLTVGNAIEDSAGMRNFSDAIEGQTLALTQWLMESDAVFALLLAPDGAIRMRNKASQRLFGHNSSTNFGASIWDYLGCSDAEFLRSQLADARAQPAESRRLNLSDTQGNPVTLEVGLLKTSGATLLLGAVEQQHDEALKTELLKVTGDMSVMMRESARNNRELKKANETIQRLARTDALTGLANRRTLEETFQREIARASRLGENLSLLVADLDHFKSINDTYGHVAGDQVLVAAASVFGSHLRPYDLAARYGGEEFVLLLPGTATSEAHTIAERIRSEIEIVSVDNCPRRVTLSLGIATWLPGETQEQFISRADAALYLAKAGGRNRVEIAANHCAAPQRSISQ